MMTNFTGDESHQTFEELHCSGELTAGIKPPADLSVGVKYCPVLYCIFRECSDPSRPSQGVVASFFVQSLVSQLGDN